MNETLLVINLYYLVTVSLLAGLVTVALADNLTPKHWVNSNYQLTLIFLKGAFGYPYALVWFALHLVLATFEAIVTTVQIFRNPKKLFLDDRKMDYLISYALANKVEEVNANSALRSI